MQQQAVWSKEIEINTLLIKKILSNDETLRI